MFLQEEEDLEWYSVAWSDLLRKVGIRNQPHLDYEEVEEDLQERLQMPAGVTMRVNQQDTQEDPAVSVTLYGEDTRVLMGMAQEVERRLESIPGLLSIDTDMDRGGTELSSGSIAPRCSASESAPKRFLAVFLMPCAVIKSTSSTLKTGGKSIFRCSWKRTIARIYRIYAALLFQWKTAEKCRLSHWPRSMWSGR